jgi:hypothetical protein
LTVLINLFAELSQTTGYKRCDKIFPLTFALMKRLLVFILSLIVLTGSLTPCCPGDNCGDEMTGQASSEKQDHEQEGVCSPFFACGSCPGFVQLARHFSVPVPEVNASVHHEKLTVLITSAYYSSFFQPPRNG